MIDEIDLYDQRCEDLEIEVIKRTNDKKKKIVKMFGLMGT